ncbi:MAG: adenylate/guanylate cyclase domain-containing protein [Solirubrobacteraceae bacterium]
MHSTGGRDGEMTDRRALFGVASGNRLRGLLLGLVALASAAIAIAAYATDLLKPQDRSTIDTRFSVRGADRPPSNIVVVKIDDKTFQDLGQQWPFPRATHARVLDRIAAEHPAAIAYDVQFSETSNRGQNDDLKLLEALDKHHGVTVFSFTETDAHGDVIFLGSGKGTKLLHQVGAQPANGLFPFDSSDGLIRRMSFSIGHLDTLAVVTAQTATHRRVDRSKFPGGSNWIDFVGPAGTFRSVDFADVYDNRVPPNSFRGKIVVIGATAPSLHDINPTSTDGQMPGAEIQANAIDTVLRGMPLSSAPGWVNIALIVLLALAVPVVSLRASPLAATGVALALGAIFTVAVQLAFNDGWIVSFIYPVGALVLGAVGSLTVQLVTEAFERIRVRDLFSRFVPENVVDEVLKSADGLRLGGIQREGTVMFSDLRGFTTLAESLTPARVIEVLNRYLSEMSDAILDHGGTLVAYMGDGIMAVFGAPLPQADHADRALKAAREMLEVRLPRFNEWLRSEGLSEGFRMGIGLNSGSVMSGHVGSERRVEYTAVGDTTNTASRIEALTKGTPHQLLMSGATREALLAAPSDLVHVGETEIRGRTAKLDLWSLPEIETNLEPEPLKATGQGV